jgi:GNAT superfamily N-acetyltransferase
MTIHLRVATIDDIPSIAALIAASVRQLQVEYTPAEREAAIATVFTVDSRLVADGTYLLALSEDGRLVGCGGWSRRTTLYGGDHQIEAAEPGLLDAECDAAKVRAIFVHPEFARQGIGGAVLEASERAAMAEGFMQFEMGSTLTGVALYRVRGYREVETIEVPVGGGESIKVVRMVKMVKMDKDKPEAEWNDH